MAPAGEKAACAAVRRRMAGLLQQLAAGGVLGERAGPRPSCSAAAGAATFDILARGKQSQRLAGKVAIVTGGANGIGRQTATIFAAEGASVVIADRDSSVGEAVATLMRDSGLQMAFYETDVADESAVGALVAFTLETYGRLDILVNVAGVDIDGKIAGLEMERWERTLQVNLGGQYLTCKHSIPAMVASAGRGAIVNVSSIQANRAYGGYPAYAAAKAGIQGMSRNLALDYSSSKIRVNVVSPGAVDTNMSGNSRKLEPAYPIKAEFEEQQGGEDAATHAEAAENEAVDEVKLPAPFDPTPRLFEWSIPADVAYAILFLASDEAAGITGVNLPVDNGFSIQGLE